MSEYQYYEFVAVGQPLNAREQAEVRSLSTRADITATRFVNEYHWGNFRGDPHRMMERYYDAHLYLANWGTRRIMLRLPRKLLDLDVAEQYYVGDEVTGWGTEEHLVLDFMSDDESGDDWDIDPHGSLSAIVGVHGELVAGDHRSLYLAWLAGYGTWERDEYAFDRAADDELEPPVPPGLHTLTAAQRELADFLRVDDDLLAVATETSPPLEQSTDDPGELIAWVTNLSPAEKDHFLLRVVQDRAATVRMEMLRRFRDETTTAVISDAPRRTVAELLDEAARRRAERQRRENAQRAAEQARREKARALALQQRLDKLARDEDDAWSRVDAMIATRKPAEYDAAVALLTDLRALAERDGRTHEFTQRSTALRQQHARKPSLLVRLDQAHL
ncbi:hypothetical protein AB0H34_11045 [Saccharopolyspora shandongensis]|uniref:hypothetical protein n=1 Tax=Saccharopolyspora shandongensis TaxID=418495 RepID=UPI0033FDA91B